MNTTGENQQPLNMERQRPYLCGLCFLFRITFPIHLSRKSMKCTAYGLVLNVAFSTLFCLTLVIWVLICTLWWGPYHSPAPLSWMGTEPHSNQQFPSKWWFFNVHSIAHPSRNKERLKILTWFSSQDDPYVHGASQHSRIH